MLKKAFTLVEILIVVIVFGLLAAIIVPQFVNTAEDEKKLALLHAEIQDQIKQFKSRTGSYPTLEQLSTNPKSGSEQRGWGALIDGGYIEKAPLNPIALPSHQHKISATGGQGFGWEYNEKTGWLGATYYNEKTGRMTIEP